MDASGEMAGERAFAHGGEGLAMLCDWLVERSGAAPGAIDVAIEAPHGPVVEALLERGFAVHAIKPKQLDRFRDRRTVAGAKDDRRDARVLADALRTDPHYFRRIVAADPVLVELREWSRVAESCSKSAPVSPTGSASSSVGTTRRSWNSATTSPPPGSSISWSSRPPPPPRPGSARRRSRGRWSSSASGASAGARRSRSCGGRR